jgi:hypothetical protein
VAITHAGLNTGAGGTARLYLNGRLQGAAKDIREPFTRNISQATIRLGVNYVGLWDDPSLFNRAVSDREVELLYQLKGGLPPCISRAPARATATRIHTERAELHI